MSNKLIVPVNFDPNGLAKLGINPDTCCRSLRPAYDGGPYWERQPTGLQCNCLFIASLILRNQ